MIPEVKAMNTRSKNTVEAHIECIAFELPVQIDRDYKFFKLKKDALLDICKSNLAMRPEKEVGQRLRLVLLFFTLGN